MSITLVVWLLLFGSFALLAFSRPAWGVALYMLTVFLCPPFWWWGDAIAPYRWNFYGGWIMLVAVVLSRIAGSERLGAHDDRDTRRIAWIAVAFVINASLVHAALAANWGISSGPYIELAKFALLFFLITMAVRDETDYRIVLLAILLGAAYLGYEVTVNDRGRIVATRLEGIGIPNATSANGLASLMVTVLPLTGVFFLVGRRWEKLLMLLAAPFIVNVLLLCDSRGAFLACIASAVVFLAAAPAGMRKKTMKVVALGCVAVWLLLGDPRIVERFWTTFSDKEELDNSAASRLDYWQAGLRMLADYPLGSGGDGFHDVHGPKYIARVSGAQFDSRSVHNGYINTACDWGIQGLFLQLAFLGGALGALWRTMRACNARGDERGALLACGLFAGLVGFLVTSLFGDYLDNEWGYWMAACAVGHSKLYSIQNSPAYGLREPLDHGDRFVLRTGGISAS